MKKILFSIFLTIVFFATIWLVPKTEEVLNFSKVTPQPINEISAWIPDYEEKRGLESLKTSKSFLKIVSPVWYNLDTNGLVIDLRSPYKQTTLKELNLAKIKVLPTIFNVFDGRRVSLLINNPILRNQIINSLVETALSSGYSGWDLDWEKVYTIDKDKYSEFVDSLARELHKKNLLLAVTVHAQTGTSSDWEESKGHDYQALGRSADFIRIMAYDFHYETSAPGPITPLDKLTEVLQFALSTIPKEKIILGLPTYGYDWNFKKTNSLQYQEVYEILKKLRTQPIRDPISQALHFKYRAEGISHEIWFEDHQSIQAKVSLAQKYNINKFILWHLGGEDPEIWKIF